MLLQVLANAPEWVIVAKPPRLLVHRTHDRCVEDAALQILRRQVGRHVYPIHRLDRAASGCLLFALERSWASILQSALTGPTARKQYVCLVRGDLTSEETIRVNTPMKDDNGILKEASSVVRRLASSKEPRCSLLLVEPLTGRYHQVRRHVRDLSHPVIGDTRHGDSHMNRFWRETFGALRLQLHAVSLEATLPDGATIRATCPLFEDMASVFRQMPWWEDVVHALPELALPPLPLPEY